MGHNRSRQVRNVFDNRLRAVEQVVLEIRTELKHLATKEDLAELKRLITEDVQAVNVMIADREASIQRWLMGTLVTVIIALAVAQFSLSSVAS